jgi:hypothetical protein
LDRATRFSSVMTLLVITILVIICPFLVNTHSIVMGMEHTLLGSLVLTLLHSQVSLRMPLLACIESLDVLVSPQTMFLLMHLLLLMKLVVNICSYLPFLFTNFFTFEFSSNYHCFYRCCLWMGGRSVGDSNEQNCPNRRILYCCCWQQWQGW